MAAMLKHLGFDYVFDTNFAADLTVMEEATEFLNRLTRPIGCGMLPMFTSCCPGWLRFVKTQFQELLPHVSTCKSPQQMFGAVAKTYFAEQMGIDPRKIVCVSIMPCTAKKDELTWDGMDSAGTGRDVDIVLTTRELARMIRADGFVPEKMPEEEFDSPLGEYTGAGVIFGATGGVMEAALRTAHKLATGENPNADAFDAVRGMKPWKEIEVKAGAATVRAAVVHGLGNARAMIEAIKRGEAHYDFIEVMACPGGCVGGGRQPIHDGQECAALRAPVLYTLDQEKPIRFSHDNPELIKLYEEYLITPCGERAHRLLHVEHKADA